MWKTLLIFIFGLVWINYDTIINICKKRFINDDLSDIFIENKETSYNHDQYVITETSNEIIENVLKQIDI